MDWNDTKVFEGQCDFSHNSYPGGTLWLCSGQEEFMFCWHFTWQKGDRSATHRIHVFASVWSFEMQAGLTVFNICNFSSLPFSSVPFSLIPDPCTCYIGSQTSLSDISDPLATKYSISIKITVKSSSWQQRWCFWTEKQDTNHWHSSVLTSQQC